MTTKPGRSPSGRAGRASPEPASSLGHSATIPNADDVRFLGAGPDPRGGFTFTFADGEENGVIHLLAAHLFDMMGVGTPHELNCVQMEVKPRDFAQSFTLTLQRQGGKTPLQLRNEAEKRLTDALTAVLDVCEGERSPIGKLGSIYRIAAQGIEAQRAATAKRGAVHESPVGNADAPKD